MSKQEYKHLFFVVKKVEIYLYWRIYWNGTRYFINEIKYVSFLFYDSCFEAQLVTFEEDVYYYYLWNLQSLVFFIYTIKIFIK